MYNNQLPPLSTTDKPVNGDSQDIKQEQHDDLPNNHSRMSINQLCNDTDDEVKEAAAVLENMKQGLPSIEIPPHSTQIEHDGSGQMPTSPLGETDNTLMSRIGDDDVIIGGEKDGASGQNDCESRKRGVHGELRSSSPSYRSPSRSHRSSQSNGSQNSSSLYSYPNNNNYTASNPTTTYATQHIGNQIAALKSIIDSFTSPASSGALITQSTSKLASIKKEVVDTLRKVIEVVSKYASICLPEHAKHNVRSFILSLPSRWASINHSDHSSSASPTASPRLAPSNAHINQTTDYARRLLSLANESLDMLRSVAGIFSETVGRAEAWVERLSSFGVTGGGANAMGHIHFDSIPQPNGNGYTYSQATSSPPSHSPVTPRSRRTSTNSARMNRRFRTTHPLIDDEDDDFSDSSSESDAESMRMEMDGRRVKSTSHSNGSLNGAKKRKKAGKKSENDRMDLS
ncbi:21101_t:CDS:2 [Cetraspora pellucida]|uniref:21101_t:CDS:1 n=1 Tax=Cetraspora pellucida TaxID=1433469 RepID=A0A9N9NQZ9_9GLOM|nr:21101_t:CDS:2 [Cetraspora pellucida]